MPKQHVGLKFHKGEKKRISMAKQGGVRLQKRAKFEKRRTGGLAT